MLNINRSHKRTLEMRIESGPQARLLITWAHPTAIQDGYDVWDRLINGEPIGQFCMCPVYVTNAAGVWIGDWSSNQIASALSNADMQKIAALQVPDEFTLEQKMGWLTNGGNGNWGAPMRCTGDWQTTADARMIATVYAGQRVELTGESMVGTITLNGTTNAETLYEIKTFQAAEWSLPNASQIVTAVNKYNTHTENTKGKIKLPIYFGNRRAWVLQRWLI